MELIALVVIFQIIAWVIRSIKRQSGGTDSRRRSSPPPDDMEADGRDVSEEERKFKKWLEEVFGPGHADGQESQGGERSGRQVKYEDGYGDGDDGDYSEDDEDDYGDEDDGEYSEDDEDGYGGAGDGGYAGGGDYAGAGGGGGDNEVAAYGTGVPEPATYKGERPSAPATAGVCPAVPPAAPAVAGGRVAALACRQAAYGFVMAEIFARPKALRPRRRALPYRGFL